MDAVLPISLSLSDDSARIIGAYVRSGLIDVVRPPLDRIEHQLHALHDGMRMLSIDVVDVFKGVADRRLKVQVMNEGLLDHIEATRWAVAYLSYTTFVELLEHIRYMRWLDGRSHLHLHQIIDELTRIDGLVAVFATEVSGMGSMVIGLLQAILDTLGQGIGLTGTIQIVLSGADPLKDLDLWKLLGLLGLLALGLTLIVAFLFGVGAALATFTAGAVKAALAIGILVAGLIPLMNTIVGFKWEELGKIAVGFAAIAVFVAGLGKAFQLFTSNLSKIVPQLNTFFEAITRLMTAIAGFKWSQLGRIAALRRHRRVRRRLGQGLPQFTGYPHLCIIIPTSPLPSPPSPAAASPASPCSSPPWARPSQFTTDLGTVVPHLNTFFEAITRLITAMPASRSQPREDRRGFAGIAVFVAALQAFQQFTTDLGTVVPHLNTFFEAITRLMTAIAGFEWSQLGKIAVGNLLIAGFVWLLGKALEHAEQNGDQRDRATRQFFTAITALMVAISQFTQGQMFEIAVGFVLIAGYRVAAIHGHQHPHSAVGRSAARPGHAHHGSDHPRRNAGTHERRRDGHDGHRPGPHRCVRLAIAATLYGRPLGDAGGLVESSGRSCRPCPASRAACGVSCRTRRRHRKLLRRHRRLPLREHRAARARRGGRRRRGSGRCRTTSTAARASGRRHPGRHRRYRPRRSFRCRTGRRAHHGRSDRQRRWHQRHRHRRPLGGRLGSASPTTSWPSCKRASATCGPRRTSGPAPVQAWREGTPKMATSSSATRSAGSSSASDSDRKSSWSSSTTRTRSPTSARSATPR